MGRVMRETEDFIGSIMGDSDEERDQRSRRVELAHAATQDRAHRDRLLAASPAVIAATAMLRLAWGTRLRALDLKPQVIVLVAPSKEWGAPLTVAFRLGAKGGRETLQRNHLAASSLDRRDWVNVVQPENGKTFSLGAAISDVEAALEAGVQVLVTAHDQEALPPEIARCADLTVRVDPMDWSVLRHVAETLCAPDPRWPVEPRPSPKALAAVGPSALRLAVRRGDRARDYAARVLAIAAPEPASSPTSSPRGLARVPGMGAVEAWGRSLAADLRAYAAGDLPWSAVDRGALLVGPPGVGKTTFAAALAEECGMALVIGNHGIWQAAGHQGDALKAMRKTFAEAREQAPCLLFIDEVDSFPDRSRLGRDHGDYLRPVINALLAELDGAVSREGVVVLAACNDAGNLDPALLRAGRLERVLRVALPDVPGREEILRVHLGEELRQADLHQVARIAEGMAGAELEKSVREARRSARSRDRRLLVGDLLVAVAEARGIDLTSPMPQMTN